MYTVSEEKKVPEAEEEKGDEVEMEEPEASDEKADEEVPAEAPENVDVQPE